jgi:hypothetical protein
MRHPAWISVVAAVLPLLAVGACTAADTPGTGQGGTATTAAATPTPGPTVAGEAAGAAGDPCALVTPADVQAAFGQKVLGIRRLAVDTSDDDRIAQECDLTTDGTPMSAVEFVGLSTVASGFTGKQLSTEPVTALVGICLMRLKTPIDPNNLDVEKLPDGAKVLPGVGIFAMVLDLSTGSLGYAIASPTKAVIIYDADGRAVPEDGMEKLMRAAVARV